MFDELIPHVSEIKDLGVTFTSNFKFNKHITDITSNNALSSLSKHELKSMTKIVFDANEAGYLCPQCDHKLDKKTEMKVCENN